MQTYLSLYFHFQYRSNDGQNITGDNQEVPAIQEFPLVVFTNFTIIIVETESRKTLQRVETSHECYQTCISLYWVTIWNTKTDLIFETFVGCSCRFTRSSLKASIMERVQSTAEIIQTTITKPSNKRRYCVLFWAENKTVVHHTNQMKFTCHSRFFKYLFLKFSSSCTRHWQHQNPGLFLPFHYGNCYRRQSANKKKQHMDLFSEVTLKITFLYKSTDLDQKRVTVRQLTWANGLQIDSFERKCNLNINKPEKQQ